MENCADYLQELPLLLAQGMDTVSSLLATNGKPASLITFIAVYKILAIVEEFTAQIHKDSNMQAMLSLIYNFLFMSQPSPKQISSILLHLSCVIFLII